MVPTSLVLVAGESVEQRLMDGYALGIEISDDRRHTSVVAAGAVEGDVVLMELEWTDRAAALLPRAASCSAGALAIRTASCGQSRSLRSALCQTMTTRRATGRRAVECW